MNIDRYQHIRVFGNEGGLGNNVIGSVAEGLGCSVETLQCGKNTKLAKRDCCIVWGILRGSDQIIKRSAEKGIDWFHIDHAYVDRGHDSGNYRITKKFINSTEVREVDSKRRSDFEYDIKNWKKGGRHVLVCPPSKAIQKFFDLKGWTEQTINDLKKYTDREVRIRDKISAIKSGRTLHEDLKDCHAVVTHLSNVAVDAVLMGIPVFVDGLSAAWQVSSGTLNKIEQPSYPNREIWINSLLYQQYKLEEIRSGEIWRIRDKWQESNLIVGRLSG